MSIQSNINQGLAIGTALLSQTDFAKNKQAVRKEQKYAQGAKQALTELGVKDPENPSLPDYNNNQMTYENVSQNKKDLAKLTGKKQDIINAQNWENAMKDLQNGKSDHPDDIDREIINDMSGEPEPDDSEAGEDTTQQDYPHNAFDEKLMPRAQANAVHQQQLAALAYNQSSSFRASLEAVANAKFTDKQKKGAMAAITGAGGMYSMGGNK